MDILDNFEIIEINGEKVFLDLRVINFLENYLELDENIEISKINEIINEMAKNENVPIHYDRNMEQLEWVSLMNNYKHCAEEIIYTELIYC